MSQQPEAAHEIIESLTRRFKPEQAGDTNMTVHFDISGDRGGQYTAKVADGQCTVEEGLNGEPDCVVKASDQNYEDIELGRTNAQMAVMMGKIKISDIGEMMKFINYFERLFEE